MRIAVVIPTLDEADAIEAALAAVVAPEPPAAESSAGGAGRAAGAPAPGAAHIEVIVADGGSRDGTVERARAAGARVLRCPRGRARQLDAGWRASEGEVVLFLHADTRLPPGWATAVRAALADPGVVGGAFALRFEPRPLAMRVIEWGAALRVRWLGLPYGDQALFARRTALEAAGGVPPVALLEDLDLVRALQRQGRVVRVPLPVVTSARRYLRHGVLRVWWRNALTLAGWRLGLDRGRLAAWYRR